MKTQNRQLLAIQELINTITMWLELYCWCDYLYWL